MNTLRRIPAAASLVWALWAAAAVAAEVKVYAVPSGAGPHDVAPAPDDRDIVWASDTTGNAIVSFDPRDHRFAAFAGSAAGANVRQINGRPHEVWAAESGNDRLVRIRP